MLADLDDLSDDELHDVKEEVVKDEKGDAKPGRASVASVTDGQLYATVMQRVNDELDRDDQPGDANANANANATASASTAPATEFLNQCNELIVHLDNEIVEAYNRVRDGYRPRFPELETLVQTPLEYVSVVRAIGNEDDLTKVTELDALLPASTVMVLTVTATTTAGSGPLSPAALASVMDTCDLAHRLDADKTSVLRYLQRSMDRVAPNLTAFVGSEVAAKLMGAAGGLTQLATIPASNVQVIGAKRKNLAGFSTKASNTGSIYGFVYDAALVQESPPSIRAKAAKLVGSKCSLLARVDAHGNHKNGSIGVSNREEAAAKIAKWLEPPPARKAEVLPVPDADEAKRSKRGGRRARKMKEKYGMSDVKKAANRMGFNEAEDEFFDGEEAMGLGSLGKAGVRIVTAQQKQGLSDKAKKKYGLHRPVGAAGGTGVSGLSSSLAFTPVVGMELANPLAAKIAKKTQEDGTKSVYFGDTTGFGKVSKGGKK